MSDIGLRNEKPLHAALKAWYRQAGDGVEVPYEGFVVDLVRDGLLIEIQTRGFSAMRNKLDRLLDTHALRVVHPVAAVKWIVNLDAAGETVSRRRSPKRGIAADVCAELVAFPTLLSHPNFDLEVALVEVEEVRVPARRKRRDYTVQEQRLVEVVECVRLESSVDLVKLLPEGLPDPFTTADVAVGLGRSRHDAQQVAYCLRLAGALEVVERDRHGMWYRRP